LLQSHLKRRTELAWSKAEQEPVHYVTRHVVSRKEREFDPVLQTFRNDDREANARREEGSTRVRKLNASKAGQLHRVQRYNVINHHPALPGIPPHNSSPAVDLEAAEKKRKQQTRTNYNIISNIDLAEHHYGHPSTRPPATQTEPRKQAQVGRRSSHPDCDIISNRYRKNHEVKTSIDQQVAKQTASNKYWATHDFDPVSCKFYSEKKEARFQEKRVVMEKDHGKDFAKSLPPSIKDSQGMHSDIITMRSKAASTTSSMRARASPLARAGHCASQPSLREAVEQSQGRHSAAMTALGETRVFNRNSAQRSRELHGYNNGYDILSTKPFVGRGGVNKAPLRVAERPTLWDRLERQTRPLSRSSSQPALAAAEKPPSEQVSSS